MSGMGFSNAQQLREVLLACGMGFLLGLGYDLIAGWHRPTRSARWRVLAGDCLYASAAAVAVFLFSLALTGGTVRGYVLLSLPVGAAAYHRTVGRAVRCGRRAAAACRRRVRAWLRPRWTRWRGHAEALRGKIGEPPRKAAKKIELF